MTHELLRDESCLNEYTLDVYCSALCYQGRRGEHVMNMCVYVSVMMVQANMTDTVDFPICQG